MSSMLIDDRPIIFLPMLAKALGSCERAIVLQQIHWLSRLPNSGMWDDEGNHWVWGTYEEWCKEYFPMWSPHTLAKIIRKLEQMGVLISAQLKAHEHDRTKYYRINYRHTLLESPNLPNQVASNVPNDVPSNRPELVDSSISETSAKNTQKNGERPIRAQRRKDRARPTNQRDYRPYDDDDPDRRRKYTVDDDTE